MYAHDRRSKQISNCRFQCLVVLLLYIRIITVFLSDFTFVSYYILAFMCVPVSHELCSAGTCIVISSGHQTTTT